MRATSSGCVLITAVAAAAVVVVVVVRNRESRGQSVGEEKEKMTDRSIDGE